MQEQQKQKLINEIITFVSGTPEELQRVRLALQDDSVSQLQDTVNRAYAASARRAHVELALVQNGLANRPENWSIVRTHPSLSGANYTPENFRYLVETNPGFKASLKRDAEPFAKALGEEKKQRSRHQAKVVIFNSPARALTGRGVKNVAANEPNFSV